jgi:hypothetical protein
MDERPRIQIIISIKPEFWPMLKKKLHSYNYRDLISEADESDANSIKVKIIATAGEFYELGRFIGKLEGLYNYLI